MSSSVPSATADEAVEPEMAEVGEDRARTVTLMFLPLKVATAGEGAKEPLFALAKIEDAVPPSSLGFSADELVFVVPFRLKTRRNIKSGGCLSKVCPTREGQREGRIRTLPSKLKFKFTRKERAFSLGPLGSVRMKLVGFQLNNGCCP